MCQCPTGKLRFGKAERWITTDQSGPPVSGPVPCEAQSFAGADPVVGVTKECWCEVKKQERQEQQAPARVAVVLLTRHPPNLDLWLKYHLNYMGVEHVFMQVEDTPQFNSTWAGIAGAERQRVTVWRAAAADRGFGGRPADDYTSLQSRQMRTMLRAKESAALRGIQWLVHIDDDELLYTPMHRPVSELLRAMPANFAQAYIPNAEAIYPSADVRDCFTETTEVNMNAYTFVSYANGKSAVRVDFPGASPAGPHQWRYMDGQELPSIHLDREPFGAPLLVVHFESCPFARWEDKFWELGNTSAAKVQKIPFQFYRDSIRTMQACRSGAEEGGGPAASSAPEQCSAEALRHFWAQWKTEENTALRRQDLAPIRIPWQAVAAGAR